MKNDIREAGIFGLIIGLVVGAIITLPLAMTQGSKIGFESGYIVGQRERPTVTESEPYVDSAIEEIKAAYDGVSVLASFYGEESGTITANGERYRPWGFTAADRTSPFGAIFLAENRDNGRQTVVRLNDRGPARKYAKRRIDVSHGAARELGMEETGLAVLQLRYIGSVGRTMREMVQTRLSGPSIQD